MRFITLIALLPLAFALAPLVSRTTPINNTARAISKVVDVETFTNPAGQPFTCEDFATRKHNCQCRDGLIKPSGYKAGGRKPADNCQCGDKKNSEGYYDHKGHLKCDCPGKDQYYNYDTNMCDCATSCKEVRKHDVLTCVPLPPKPTHKMNHPKNKHNSRSIKNALAKRQEGIESRAVETTLGCKSSEKACQNGDEWSCVEVMSSLVTCGGCAGEAIDCSALPGASEVHCGAGQCVIDTCARGFKLTVPSSAGVTTTQPAICQPIRRGDSMAFHVQGVAF